LQKRITLNRAWRLPENSKEKRLPRVSVFRIIWDWIPELAPTSSIGCELNLEKLPASVCSSQPPLE